MNTWSEYVRDLTGDAPQDEVGAKVGVSGSTISRWRAGKRPGQPAEVAALAQAYDGHVLEAFVAAGFLTYEQAGLEDPLEQQIALAEKNLIALHLQAHEAQAKLDELIARRANRRERDALDGQQGLAADMVRLARERALSSNAVEVVRVHAGRMEQMLNSWPDAERAALEESISAPLWAALREGGPSDVVRAFQAMSSGMADAVALRGPNGPDSGSLPLGADDSGEDD